MISPKPQDTRVGAYASLNGDTMELFGYGILEDNSIPNTDDVKMFGKSLKEMHLAKPSIKLDSGERIWVCECYWGPESEIQKKRKTD